MEGQRKINLSLDIWKGFQELWLEKLTLRQEVNKTFQEGE